MVVAEGAESHISLRDTSSGWRFFNLFAAVSLIRSDIQDAVNMFGVFLGARHQKDAVVQMIFAFTVFWRKVNSFLNYLAGGHQRRES